DAVQLLTQGEAEQIARLIVGECRGGRRGRRRTRTGGRGRGRRGGVLREDERGERDQNRARTGAANQLASGVFHGPARYSLGSAIASDFSVAAAPPEGYADSG